MTLDKRVIWVRDDGTISITCFLESGRRPGELDDDFIDREIQKIKDSSPELANLKTYIVSKTDLRNEVLKHPELDKRSLRCDKSGVVSCDVSYVSEDTKNKSHKDSIKNKLITLGLTEDETNSLVK